MTARIQGTPMHSAGHTLFVSPGSAANPAAAPLSPFEAADTSAPLIDDSTTWSSPIDEFTLDPQTSSSTSIFASAASGPPLTPPAGAPNGAGGEGSGGEGGGGEKKKPEPKLLSGKVLRFPVPGGWQIFAQTDLKNFTAGATLHIARRGREKFELRRMDDAPSSPDDIRVSFSVDGRALGEASFGLRSEGAENILVVSGLPINDDTAPFIYWLSNQAAEMGATMGMEAAAGGLSKFLLLDHKRRLTGYPGIRMVAGEGRPINWSLNSVSFDSPAAGVNDRNGRHYEDPIFRNFSGTVFFTPAKERGPVDTGDFLNTGKFQWAFLLPNSSLHGLIKLRVREQMDHASAKKDDLLCRYLTELDKFIDSIWRNIESTDETARVGNSSLQNETPSRRMARLSAALAAELAGMVRLAAGNGGARHPMLAEELLAASAKIEGSIKKDLRRRAAAAGQLEYLKERLGPALTRLFDIDSHGNVKVADTRTIPADGEEAKNPYAVGADYLLNNLPISPAASFLPVFHEIAPAMRAADSTNDGLDGVLISSKQTLSSMKRVCDALMNKYKRVLRRGLLLDGAAHTIIRRLNSLAKQVEAMDDVILKSETANLLHAHLHSINGGQASFVSQKLWEYISMLKSGEAAFEGLGAFLCVPADATEENVICGRFKPSSPAPTLPRSDNHPTVIALNAKIAFLTESAEAKAPAPVKTTDHGANFSNVDTSIHDCHSEPQAKNPVESTRSGAQRGMTPLKTETGSPASVVTHAQDVEDNAASVEAVFRNDLKNLRQLLGQIAQSRNDKGMVRSIASRDRYVDMGYGVEIQTPRYLEEKFAEGSPEVRFSAINNAGAMNSIARTILASERNATIPPEDAPADFRAIIEQIGNFKPGSRIRGVHPSLSIASRLYMVSKYKETVKPNRGRGTVSPEIWSLPETRAEVQRDFKRAIEVFFGAIEGLDLPSFTNGMVLNVDFLFSAAFIGERLIDRALTSDNAADIAREADDFVRQNPKIRARSIIDPIAKVRYPHLRKMRGFAFRFELFALRHLAGLESVEAVEALPRRPHRHSADAAVESAQYGERSRTTDLVEFKTFDSHAEALHVSEAQHEWLARYLIGPGGNGRLREANVQLLDEFQSNPRRFKGKKSFFFGIQLAADAKDFGPLEKQFDDSLETVRAEGGIVDSATLFFFKTGDMTPVHIHTWPAKH